MDAAALQDAIAERLFNTLQHDRFLLEYDSERAGGFEPLRFVPKGKVVVLGLISTKVPETPSVDELRRRIDEAARYVPLEQLGQEALRAAIDEPDAFSRTPEQGLTLGTYLVHRDSVAMPPR